jgi:flagellar biosynthetic protein FlhB
MAGDKTEKPTAKKTKEAREKGQVARSRELVAAASLLAVTGALVWIGPHLIAGLETQLIAGLRRIGDRPLQTVSSGDLSALTWSGMGRLVLIAGPVAITAAVAAVAGNLVQTGWVSSPQALEWKWDRLNPAKGLAKFAPGRAGTEILRALLAVVVLGAIGWQAGAEICRRSPELVGMAPAAVGARAWDVLWRLTMRAGMALVGLAGIDYAIQWYRLRSSLKMSRQEVQDEAKTNEGNPEVKNRVRKVQRLMARRRMLAAVKNATVVVTNPTHFAVALEYHRATMAAPVVLAKGQDHLAAKIREVARKHGIPVVENVALARALFKTAEVGDLIPAPLFGAVAEVLAYLVRIKQLML